MYEAMAADAVKKDILSELSGWNTDEGSFADSLAAPIGHEIWRTYQSMDALLDVLCLAVDSGEYLVKRAEDYGLKRLEGTPAGGVVLLSGTDGAMLPAGTLLTAEGILFATEEDAVLTEGSTTADVQAQSVGIAGNLPAGTVLVPVTAVSGLVSITAAGDFTGGTDEESTEALRVRLLYLLQNTPASGNAADYKVWATSVPGVGNARVRPLANGPGTVEVVLTGDENAEPGEDVVAAVQAYIEEQRPIGAAVTVTGCTALEISVDVALVISDAVLTETVQEQITTAIREYFAAFDGETVYYNRLVQLIMAADGVENITALSVNGAETDIPVAYNQVPSLGEVTVTV